MSKMGWSPSSPNSSSFSKKIATVGWFSRLKVGQKIALGYAIVLGVAVCGTTLGVTVANRNYQKALRLQEDSLQETLLVHRLHNHLSLAIIHQNQLIYLLENPVKFQREYAEIQRHERILHQTWQGLELSYNTSEVKESSKELDAMAEINRGYDSIIVNYFQRLNQLLENIELNPLTPENRAEAEQLLLEFQKSESFERLEDFINSLETLLELVEEEALEAEAEMKASEQLGIQIVIFSMLVSVFIAIVFAFYTSKAITHPIKILTQTANRVKQDSNFDLQVAQITEDEIGELTQVFNHLILRVKQLIESQNQATKTQLIQQEKMSTLGRLLAEVAHEINNPLNFIYGNLIHAIEYTDDLFNLLQTYEAEIDRPSEKILMKAEEVDREFLEEDLPKLLQSMKIGAERTKEIILSLKNVSRFDRQEQAKPLKLSECLDSSLVILNHRLKRGIIVTKHYQNIPPIEGYMSSLSQVFINIIGNAIDALSEVDRPAKEIKISAEPLNSERVAVHIADNGLGISPENQQKIFESFFTTKPVNVGTGLGLSISREIIENKHGGKLLCHSTEGVGTEFVIILPIKYSPSPSVSPPENYQNPSNQDRKQLVEYT